MWDDDAYRDVRRNLDASAAARQRELRFEAVRDILDYEVPYVQMIDHDFGHAVGAFERINTLGVKLKQNDIDSAQIAARHSGFIADEGFPFLDRVRRMGFIRLNITHPFRACASTAKPDGYARTPLHKLDTREVQWAWRKT